VSLPLLPLLLPMTITGHLLLQPPQKKVSCLSLRHSPEAEKDLHTVAWSRMPCVRGPEGDGDDDDELDPECHHHHYFVTD
jgi:hypothetical protein